MKKFIVPLLTALLLSACSSTWDNMSEDTIGAWKAAGVDVEMANQLTENNITPEQYTQWKDVKITDPEVIIEWSKEMFSAEDAKAWMDSGFDLDDAVDNRADGLSPVPEDADPVKE